MIGQILIGTMIIIVVVFIFWNKRQVDLFNYKDQILNDCINWDEENSENLKSIDDSAFTWCLGKLPENKKVIWNFTPINNDSMLSEEMIRKFGYDLSDGIKTIAELEEEKERARGRDDFERAKEILDEINRRKNEKETGAST
jgi:hypothetical protein